MIDLKNQHLVGESTQTIKIMEVCGSHTQAIYESGMHEVLPPTIKLVSGPGCPVCVTPNEFIDQAIALALIPNVILATFGDLLHIPGTTSTLQQSKQHGANIKMIYSPLDVMTLSKQFPQHEIVFLALGFETTAPSVSLLLQQLERSGITNVTLLNGLKQMPGVIDYILGDKNSDIDALLCPGHVASIIGTKPFEALAIKHHLPMIVSGFEPQNILTNLKNLQKMKQQNVSTCLNGYHTYVRAEGNKKATDLMFHYFEPGDSHWRGMGCLKETGLQLKREYQQFDATHRFSLAPIQMSPQTNCRCGDVLKGKIVPKNCPAFNKTCTPNTPKGPCMVATEGACGIAFNYLRK